jgi:hypothetical protein
LKLLHEQKPAAGAGSGVLKSSVNQYERLFKNLWEIYCRTSERKASGLITTPHLYNWSEGMKKLALVFAVGAAALLSGSAANAADNTGKAKAATDVTQSSTSSTDISARRRYYRHYGYRHYRPYYRSYGYAPRPYGYGGPYYGRGYGYGYGGPGISFSLGGGGYRGW